MEEPLKHPNLRVFKQHGFQAQKLSGTKQVYGRCPFCGHDKFFVNIESKAWDCKVCSKSGGFKTFLKETAIHFQQFFKGDAAIALSKNRGIQINTLREHSIGYNPFTEAYTLPIKDITGKEMWDVKTYKDKKLSISAGCTTGIYGWEQFANNKSKDVWICEGEWDGIVLGEIFKQLQIIDIVIAAPGATTFKPEWATLLKNKNVRVLYDNDDAGKDGCVRLDSIIKNVAHSINYLHWSEDYSQGFDIRDLYNSYSHNQKKTLSKIMESLTGDLPRSAGNVEKEKQLEESKEIEFSGTGATPEQVYKTYRKWLSLTNTDILDVMFGTMIANRWEGNPVWLLMVAPSGGVKTELLMTLDDSPQVTTTSDVSSHALISGANFAGNGDPSLIPQLDGMVWLIKDLTVILNKNEQEREEFFGILRDAYDGKTEKRFGNGVFRSFISKFGIIAGVTPAVELYSDNHVALGERFIRFNIPISNLLDAQRAIAKRALKNTGFENQMRDQLKEIAKQTLEFDFGSAPEVEDEIEDKIVALAQWSSLLRATINRDKYSKEVTHRPFAELPTRLSKQFYKLIQGIAAFRHKKIAGESEFDILRRVAISTIPARLEILVHSIYINQRKEKFSSKELIDIIGLPKITVDRLLENLVMLKILSKEIHTLNSQYYLSDEAIYLMSYTGLYQTERK